MEQQKHRRYDEKTTLQKLGVADFKHISIEKSQLYPLSYPI